MATLAALTATQTATVSGERMSMRMQWRPSACAFASAASFTST